MRIQSVKEVNTQQQQNPFFVQKAGAVTAGNSASPVSFKDCLRTQIQDTKAPTAMREAELVTASSLWNFLMPGGATQKSAAQKNVTQKPGMKPKARAYLSLSDL